MKKRRKKIQKGPEARIPNSPNKSIEDTVVKPAKDGGQFGERRKLLYPLRRVSYRTGKVPNGDGSHAKRRTCRVESNRIEDHEYLNLSEIPVIVVFTVSARPQPRAPALCGVAHASPRGRFLPLTRVEEPPLPPPPFENLSSPSQASHRSLRSVALSVSLSLSHSLQRLSRGGGRRREARHVTVSAILVPAANGLET
ncbi:hypothetical protein NL676_027319 [Syzygium grande]|nr:hypothetical protein NL676_027319 [Syzygium grande]